MNADTDNEDDEQSSPNVNPAVSNTKIDSIQSIDHCSAYQTDVLKDYDERIEDEKIKSDKLMYRLDSRNLESGTHEMNELTGLPIDVSNQQINRNSNEPKSILRSSQGKRLTRDIE